MIPDVLRPPLSRIIGAAVAALITYLATKLGRELTPENLDAAREIGVFLAFASYGAVHKLISAKINPTDSAAPSLSRVATGPMGGGERRDLASSLDKLATGEAAIPEPVPTAALGFASIPPQRGARARDFGSPRAREAEIPLDKGEKGDDL